MNPLSLTVDIVTVLSLTSTIGRSALDIKRFLDTISDAPSEIARLRVVIEQLCNIANSVKAVLGQQKITQHEDTFYSNHILDALSTCQSTLDSLENVLKRATKHKKGKTFISRTWSEIQLACKKELISDIEWQLERTVNVLNATFLLDLIHAKSSMTSAIGEVAKRQSLISKEIMDLRHEFASQHCHLRAATTNGTAAIPCSRKTSLFRTWAYNEGFNIQYHQISRRHHHCSLSLRMRIFGYAIVAHLYWPSTQSMIPWNISIRNLISHDAEVVRACEIGDSICVRNLLARGAARPNDMTINNISLLGIAIQAGSEEIVQLLLREGADANVPCGVYNTSLTQMAVALDRPNIVRILLRYNADPGYISGRGWSILHYLFNGSKCTKNTVYYPMFGDYLMFDGDAKDSVGWTSLHRCAAYGTAQDVRYIHRLGASTCLDQYVTYQGLNPLHIAALNNNAVALEALANLHKLRANTQDDLGSTACLLDVADFYGWTPLHHAVYRRAKDTTKWLLYNGADPHRETYRTAGWFPVGHEGAALKTGDLAKISGDDCLRDFVENLREVGYDVTIDGEDIFWSSDDCLPAIV
ncbi:hypothetical protein V2G26_021040 [Clonostachys chloroleuca]